MVFSSLADALELEPNHLEALKLMAQLLTERKKYGEAGRIIETLAASGLPEKELLKMEYPVAVALADRRAASFIKAPDYSRPIEIKLRLCELEKGCSLHPYDLGQIYRKAKDYTSAADAFISALEIRRAEKEPATPEPKRIILEIGDCYLKAEDYEQAVHWFSRLANEYPEDPLGSAMLDLVTVEKLLAEGGKLDVETIRRALDK